MELESQLLTNKFVIGYDNDTNVKKKQISRDFFLIQKAFIIINLKFLRTNIYEIMFYILQTTRHFKNSTWCMFKFSTNGACAFCNCYGELRYVQFPKVINSAYRNDFYKYYGNWSASPDLLMWFVCRNFCISIFHINKCEFTA